MKVWVTKYFFTRGVIEIDGASYWSRDGGRGDGSVVTVPWPGGMNGEAMFFGCDWQLSKEAAADRCREMIASKRKSIAKQLRKIDKLEAELDKAPKADKDGGGGG